MWLTSLEYTFSALIFNLLASLGLKLRIQFSFKSHLKFSEYCESLIAMKFWISTLQELYIWWQVLGLLCSSSCLKHFKILGFSVYLESSSVVDNLAYLATKVNRMGLLFSLIQCVWKKYVHKNVILFCARLFFHFKLDIKLVMFQWSCEKV